MAAAGDGPGLHIKIGYYNGKPLSDIHNKS